VEAGQQAQALASLETLLAEEPSSSDALLLSGVLLAEAGRIEEAKGEFQKLVELHPGLPEAHNNLAVMLAAEGDYEAALESLKGALGTSVSYRIAYENLTRIFAQLASEAYGRALEIDTPDRQQVGLVLLGKLSSEAEDRLAPAETFTLASVETETDSVSSMQP
jgi:Flp pilus assembly protein TadD